MPTRRTRRLFLSCCALAVSSLAQADPYTLWVTETPAGGTAPYAAQQKGGLRSYVFDGLGYAPGNISAGSSIPAASLNDPSAVLVDTGGSLYISNRGFNQGAGSVSRVTFSGGLPNAPTVALSGLNTGPHQDALTSSGGLVVSSFSTGSTLFPGAALPGTTTYASGAARGEVAVGSLLYGTSGNSVVQTFNIATGALLSSFTVSGSALLHYGTSFGGSLYFADIGGGSNGSGGGVFKVTLDGSGTPVSSARVASVDGAISVAFSPSGDEMFVAGHFSGLLTGFAVGPGGSVAATSNLVLDGGTLASWSGSHVTYGGIAIAAVPEPGAWALLLAGLGLVGGAVGRRSASA